nr:hypothetical protein [Tanacetum cinerariifolium]
MSQKSLCNSFRILSRKVQGTDSYEFLLANKKSVVNDDVFRMILNICPRVEGVNFTDVPDDDTTLGFLINLESVPKPAKGRKSSKVTSDPPKNLKGVPSLTQEEQEAADIMQALKESKKTSKRQPGTGGSSKGTGFHDKEDDINKETVIPEWGSEQESKYSEEYKLNDEEKDNKEGDTDDENESDKDDIYKYNICVRKDEDEEMLNAEVKDSDKGDEEVTNAAKANAKNTSEVKDDPKKTELPPTSSSLSINSLLEVKIQSEVLHTQSQSMLSVPVSVISEPTVLTTVQESPSIVTVKTLPYPSISTTQSVTQQTTTPIPTLPIRTDALIITTTVYESDALFAGKKTKRGRTIKSESSKKPSTTKETLKGKASSKGFKTSKTASANEPVEEPIAKVVMDDAGDCYPFDLSKTLPLKGHPGHLLVAADYFFNNDLEYLKSFDLKKTYTTSITKTRAARYEIDGIENMVPTL